MRSMSLASKADIYIIYIYFNILTFFRNFNLLLLMNHHHLSLIDSFLFKEISLLIRTNKLL